MDKSIAITLIIVLGIIVLTGFTYTTFSVFLPSTNTITGNGEATVEAIPNLVTIYFNVETEGDTSQEATEENAEIVDDLIVNVLKLGFERKDITTSNFNVYPNYKWEDRNREEDGYKATHRIRIEMSTDYTSKIGQVIDAGVEAGAGISYINFELSQEKQNEYKAEAIKLAAEDAKIKAEALAKGLDKKLGKLISVSDSHFGYSPWRIYGAEGASLGVAEAKSATTNIQPGEQKISASVRAVFKIR